MTPLSQNILQEYQVRKTAQQKRRFIELIKQHFPKTQIEEGGFPKSKNIIIGDIETAKVVICAHYDTCAQLFFPNFIAPNNPLISILYSILLIMPMFLILFVANLIFTYIISNFWIQYALSLAIYITFFFLIIAGPPNKHTANDNTSGVIVLCELLEVLTESERSRAAFVFFDHEETGLIGSSFFRSKHRKLMLNKLLVNIDCVSDGDYIFISASRAARKEYSNMIHTAFTPSGNKSVLFQKAEKAYYPSDQLGFKKHIVIAALKHKKIIGYHIDRIHTSKDTVFEKENIKLICDGIHNLLKKI